MARRSRKNGRFTKTRTRRRTKKKFNIAKATETALIANAATTGIFGTNLSEFFGIGGFKGGMNQITIPEIFSMMTGGTGGMSSSFMKSHGITGSIKKNLTDGGLMALGQMIAIPVVFRMARKVLAKPLINPTNRALKSAGLDVKL